MNNFIHYAADGSRQGSFVNGVAYHKEGAGILGNLPLHQVSHCGNALVLRSRMSRSAKQTTSLMRSKLSKLGLRILQLLEWTVAGTHVQILAADMQLAANHRI